MMWILIQVICICGTFVITETPNFYHTEENNNITIEWEAHTKTDLTLANFFCVLQSNTSKVLYEMTNGNEHTASQHQQFAGRVQLDKDALREGRIRLHLSTVTSEDSGKYWCDLVADYDKSMKRWKLDTSKNFILNVTQTSDDENINTATKEPASGVKHPSGCPMQNRGDLTTVGPVPGAFCLTLLVVYAI